MIIPISQLILLLTPATALLTAPACATDDAAKLASPPPALAPQENTPPPPIENKSAIPEISSYPAAERDDSLLETVNGYKIKDPYRWMEKESAADKWIEAQNKLAEDYFSKLEFPNLEKRLAEIFAIGMVASPRIAKNKIFYFKRDENMEQHALFILENGNERILVNPNELDKDFKTALDWFYPSRDGKLVAYGLSKNGSEESVLYIINVESGKNLPDTIPDTRACSLSWTLDNSAFYYTRYPKNDKYNRKAYFHKLGSNPDDDPIVFGNKKQKSDWTSVELSHDGKFLLISEDRGWTNTDLYLYDIKHNKVKTLFTDISALLRGMEMKNGQIYSVTNHSAPNYRFVAIDPAKPAPKNWKTVIPEDKHPIEWFQLVGNRVILQKLEKVSSRLYLYDLKGLKGTLAAEIKLPSIGMVESFHAEKDTGTLAFIFNSFFYPMSLFTADANAKEKELAPKNVISIKANLHPENYEVKQIEYPSYDGTLVNMFIVHKKGLELNGETPTLLYGYGGFQVNMAPYFSRRVFFWIERGGIYALPNIRGGGEQGEKWHEEGMKAKKFQSFKDFEYAARYLIAENYTSPKRLVIEGGSNGGLLMGAMLTQAPYLFACALSSVGLYDMVRYHRFPPGELWIPEYGNADNPDDTGYLLGYSPYHQIVKGVEYPAFYADTAESDTRVHWVHSAKFIAALQAANASKKPILFFLERRAGHGQGKGKSDVTKEYINKFKFIMHIVGDPAK